MTTIPIRWEPIPPGVVFPDRPEGYSPFTAGLPDTLDLLDRELWHLDVDAAVVQLDIDRSALRQDGGIRASARAASPRVRLSFVSPAGPLTFACGHYVSRNVGRAGPDWWANLRAVVLTLEALRAVDRYGAAESGEQYTGFRAIEPSAAAAGDPFHDADSAERWMRAQLDAHDTRRTDRTTVAVYRRAARALHPDVTGDRDGWDRFERAAALMRAAGML